MIHELVILARVIANRSAPSVAYNDRNQVRRDLETLAANPSILSACVTNNFGVMVAEYSRDASTLKTSNLNKRTSACLHNQDFVSRFGSEYLDLLQPILLDETQKVGELHIREDLVQLNKRFEVFSMVMLLIVVLASIVAITLSSRIQRVISMPLLNVAAVAENITANEDYSIRVDGERYDELGKLITAFNMMLDTIQQKNEALIAAKQNLEDQVEQRTAELRNINRELEAFTYSVSHDLRSPLRTIDGFSQALMEDYGKQIGDDGRDYLQRIQVASHHMGKLIDSMLYLSRVSRQEIHLQAVDLVPLAQEIASSLKQHYLRRDYRFRCPQTLVVHADKTLLEVVLQNLLGNAWKYSEKTEYPSVELGSVERHGELVYFVRDNGVGFDMKYVDKLFEPFQRLHREEEFEGLGIGLATVARIIHRHGGEIWAESILGSGAVFYFTLGSTPNLPEGQD